MNQNETRTLGFFCPRCRRSVMVQRELFALTAAPTAIPCPCGGSRLLVEYTGRDFRLTAPCAVCGRSHTVSCSETDFRTRKGIAFACQKTGLDCCYVGEEDVVCGALSRLERRVDYLDRAQGSGERDAEAQDGAARDSETPGAFLNEVVMTEMLGELRDIARRGGISCACGSKDWSLTVHYASIDLKCADCGNTLRLSAATADDLDDLCCKDSLLIRGK